MPHTPGPDDLPAQTEANAAMREAANDMLAALREIAEYMGEPAQMTPGNIQAAVVNALIRNIRAAIAKAEAAL